MKIQGANWKAEGNQQELERVREHKEGDYDGLIYA